jgi:hypothetical protein
MNIEQKIIKLEKQCFATGGIVCVSMLPDETELDALERYRVDNPGANERDYVVLLNAEDVLA